MKLKILHTNDLHSNFENYQKVATFIKQNRDETTLILDGGDFADFKSIELRGTKGLAAVELLEEVGYDALTIGNNEMFNGIDSLELMATTSSIPFISNNLLKRNLTKPQGVVSSTIIEKNGLRIFITGSSPDLGGFNEGLGIHVTSYKEEIQKEIEHHQGQYDLGILLSHVGTTADIELVSELQGIDVVISAHDHKLYSEAKIVNGVIMNSAGKYGEHVGVLELEIIKGQRPKLLNSKTVSMLDYSIDERVVSILKKNKEIAIENLSQPLYEIAKPLWHDVIEENPLTNLIADGLKDMLNCDIGLMNSGITNAGIFHYISHKKLIEVSPSPLNPTSFELKGIDLRTALEQSLDAQLCLSDGRGPGFRGKFLGRLHVSGATIKHNGKHIIEILVGNEPIDDEKWYMVASSDYLHRGSGYETLAHNRNEKYLPEEIRDVIRMYADKREFVERAYVNRWVMD